VASHSAWAAALQSSFHHRALKPGAVPLRFMVAAQALLKAVHRLRPPASSMAAGEVIGDRGCGSSISRMACHSSHCSGSMSWSKRLVLILPLADKTGSAGRRMCGSGRDRSQGIPPSQRAPPGRWPGLQRPGCAKRGQACYRDRRSHPCGWARLGRRGG
jgi:hypothetical protein